MKEKFDEGVSEGRLEMLLTLATELPEFSINKEVNTIINKPYEETERYLKMVNKKGKKATMKEILISKKLTELYLGDKKCIR